MDLNGDGYEDVITGEYSPGDVYIFPGTPRGLAAGEVIPEVITEDPDDEMGLWRWMSAAHFTDWDSDSDFDMVVGSVMGQVYLNLNRGTPTAYEFGEREPLTAGGQPMEVQSKSHPLPVDWDGDGYLDILVGDEAAGVTFFRGRAGGTFEAGVSVFTGEPVPTEGSYSEFTAWWKENSPIPGYRLRLGVADWNSDGRLDLLIGNCESGEERTTGFVYLCLRR